MLPMHSCADIPGMTAGVGNALMYCCKATLRALGIIERELLLDTTARKRHAEKGSNRMLPALNAVGC